MRQDSPRTRRMADRIKVIVAEFIERRVKDPRLGFVTVTDVKVSGDLREATVYYTVLGGDEELDSSAAALESARGLLRSQVGQQLGVKFTPSLKFVADAVPGEARNIEELLRRAKESDREIHDRASHAEYAGAPTPYRKSAPVEVGGVAPATDGGAGPVR